MSRMLIICHLVGWERWTRKRSSIESTEFKYAEKKANKENQIYETRNNKEVKEAYGLNRTKTDIWSEGCTDVFQDAHWVREFRKKFK